jgi:hypothetical protein
MRALSWFRKGVGEENPVDEFISYWTGLEIVKCILRRNLKSQRKKVDEWDGVKDIYENILHYSRFDDGAKEARNGLLHGSHELSPDFVNEISTYIEPLRKTLIISIGEIIGLEKQVTDSIILKDIRKTSLNLFNVIEGEVEGLAYEFEKIVENYPKLRLEMHNIKCEFDSEGDLKVTGEQNLRFFCTPNAKLLTKAGELWAIKDPGVKNVSIKMQK